MDQYLKLDPISREWHPSEPPKGGMNGAVVAAIAVGCSAVALVLGIALGAAAGSAGKTDVSTAGATSTTAAAGSTTLPATTTALTTAATTLAPVTAPPTTPPPATSPPTTKAPPKPKDLVLSGEGIAKTAPFALEGGSYTVRFKFGGSCYFSGDLEPTKGGSVFNSHSVGTGSGPVEGDTNVYNLDAGEYFIDMITGPAPTCPWTVTLSKR